MSDYKVIMQVAVIILISKAGERSFLDLKTVEYNSFYIVNRFSDFLKRLVIFNQVAKYYEKYVDPNSKKINDGMDIVALEIILGFIFNILLFISILLILLKSSFSFELITSSSIIISS